MRALRAGLLAVALVLAIPAIASAACTVPASYAGSAVKVAGNLDVKTADLFGFPSIYVCDNGNWKYIGKKSEWPPWPTSGRFWFEPADTWYGWEGQWKAGHIQKATAGDPADPTGRTTVDTVAVKFWMSREVYDPIDGGVSWESFPAIRLLSWGLVPGKTYYPLLTQQRWDPTPWNGWSTQNGEAMLMESIDGGYGSVTATADGTSSYVGKLPPGWYQMNYARFAMTGDTGGCSAPITTT